MTDFDTLRNESLSELDSFFDDTSVSNTKTKTSNNPLINHNDDIVLVDTIVAWRQSFFAVADVNTGWIEKQKTITIDNTIYNPLKYDSEYIKSWMLLFPSTLWKYESDEAIFKEVQDFIHKYVDVSEEYEIVSTYYVLMTYFFPHFTELPYLRVIGDYGSWKSRFLKVVGWLCYQPIMANGWISVSALFRIIDSIEWTLVFDEADIRQSDTTNDMIKILNNGFQKWLPIMRADGDKFEPKAYKVFWPKIIWSREFFSDMALESRCISYIMKRTDRKDIPINLDKVFESEAMALRNKLLRYRYNNWNKIEVFNGRIEELESRLNQIINPLLSICKDENHKTIIILNSFLFQEELKKDRYLSLEGNIFRAIKDLAIESNQISYKDLLFNIDSEYKIFPRRLGAILKAHQIQWRRTNSWFVFDMSENKAVIEKYYRQYGISE